MPMGLGSGVIVSKDGYIITNNHVVEQADEIIVTLHNGKTELKATKVGMDAGSDIAVIKVDAKDLKPVTFADSDKIKVGDIVLAVGNPFALRQTVTKGIISAVGRTQTGLSEFGNFIQTDASINPGNSGGALVDTLGRLVGINSAIYSQTGGAMGIGFAVPSNQARGVMENLIKFGKVQRGFLGIQMQELNEKLAKEFKVPDSDGILVAEVVPGGSAEKGRGEKWRRNREAERTADRRHSRIPKLSRKHDARHKGRSRNLPSWQTADHHRRAGRARNRRSRPRHSGFAGPGASESSGTRSMGVTVGDLNPELRKRFGITEDIKGALITQVSPESACADADVRAGDVIVDIDGKKVGSADEAVKLSEEVKTKSSVRLRISRKGATQFVVVEERKDN